HSGLVNSITFSPCGEHIALSSNDKPLQVWDSQTGESLFDVKVQTGNVKSVKYSPDGERLVSGGYDGTIRFWNPENGEPGVVLNSSLGAVYSLTFTPDGRRIASGHGEGGLQLWHVVSGEPGPILHGHTKPVTGIAFSPDNRWIASCSFDETVRLWDAATGTPINTLSSHKAILNDIAFSPNGLQIASGGDDSRVRLWDVDSILTSSVEQQDYLGVVWKTVHSPNGQYVLTVSNNQTVKQWSSLTGTTSPLLIELPESLFIWSASYSLNGFPTVAATQDESMRLWELQEGSSNIILEGSRVATCVTMSRCCRWIVSIDRDNTVTLWDLGSTQQMHVLIEPTHETICCLAFSANGHQLAVGNWSGTIRLFDPQSKGLTMSKSTYWGIGVISFSPDNQQLAVGTDDGLIYLRGLQSEERAIELRGHTEKVECIAYSPCGEWIASGSGDKTVQLW
ncbi:WD40 repeat-like protein, partial [Linnemannia elongata AG-77]